MLVLCQGQFINDCDGDIDIDGVNGSNYGYYLAGAYSNRPSPAAPAKGDIKNISIKGVTGHTVFNTAATTTLATVFLAWVTGANVDDVKVCDIAPSAAGGTNMGVYVTVPQASG